MQVAGCLIMLGKKRTVCLFEEYRPHCDGGCGMDPVPLGMRVASSLWLGWMHHKVHVASPTAPMYLKKTICPHDMKQIQHV